VFAWLRGKLARHEAELHKRANVIFQQAIIDLIDVGKIIDCFSPGTLVVQADFIMEDGMKPDVGKPRCVLDFTQVVAIAFAQ